jgi:hypothetical protein
MLLKMAEAQLVVPRLLVGLFLLGEHRLAGRPFLWAGLFLLAGLSLLGEP